MVIKKSSTPDGFVKCKVELSIFVQNRHGTLNSILESIRMASTNQQTNISAFNLATLGDYGMFRAVIEKDEDTIFEALIKNGYSASKSMILLVQKDMNGKKVQIDDIARALGNNSINMDYAYESTECIIVKTDSNNIRDTKNLLSSNNFLKTIL